MILNWKIGGLLLGLVFFLAVLLVKPIGVSTQFVILDGIIGNAFNAELVVKTEEGYTSSNAYLAKSKGKYAKNIANPMNYSFIFVLAMMVGAFISSMARGGLAKGESTMPALWRANFGDSAATRYLVAFLGGFVVLYGARLAGGCTSGHMMSGMMQSALSGYIFAAGAFLAAVPVARFMYKKEA
ncbi:MAG: YeeE/YedE family protein [Rhizobiaceae bacterium]|nr:YeeE/YedE family protein [Rhizobiaceae bacterium]MBL4696937.1 YeeE/YedE family protein [Rhizobiaceae bacterium]